MAMAADRWDFDFPVAGNITFVDFNEDMSYLTIGTERELRVYQMHSEHPKLVYKYDEMGINFAAQLSSSALMVLVSQNKPRIVKLLNMKKDTVMSETSYVGGIRNIAVNKQVLVVVTEHIIDIINVLSLGHVRIRPKALPSSKGAIALTKGDPGTSSLLAFASECGEVCIYDTVKEGYTRNITAHENALLALAFNDAGDKLATASEMGTVIRLFGVNTGECLAVYRRGMQRNATISCMTFSKDNQYLCCASNTETIHIFKLPEPQPPQESSWMGMLGGAVMTVTSSIVPTSVNKMLVAATLERAVMTAHLPPHELNVAGKVCGIKTFEGRQVLLVASLTGDLYYYSLSLTDSSCKLIKKQRILDLPESSCKNNNNAEVKVPQFETQHKQGTPAKTVCADPQPNVQVKESKPEPGTQATCADPKPKVQVKEFNPEPGTQATCADPQPKVQVNESKPEQGTLATCTDSQPEVQGIKRHETAAEPIHTYIQEQEFI